MSNWEWMAYVAMAIAYGWAFHYSISRHANTKAVKVIAVVMSVIMGAAWIAVVPIFAFWSLIYAGNRGRA